MRTSKLIKLHKYTVWLVFTDEVISYWFHMHPVSVMLMVNGNAVQCGGSGLPGTLCSSGVFYSSGGDWKISRRWHLLWALLEGAERPSKPCWSALFGPGWGFWVEDLFQCFNGWMVSFPDHSRSDSFHRSCVQELILLCKFFQTMPWTESINIWVHSEHHIIDHIYS